MIDVGDVEVAAGLIDGKLGGERLRREPKQLRKRAGRGFGAGELVGAGAGAVGEVDRITGGVELLDGVDLGVEDVEVARGVFDGESGGLGEGAEVVLEGMDQGKWLGGVEDGFQGGDEVGRVGVERTGPIEVGGVLGAVLRFFGAVEELGGEEVDGAVAGGDAAAAADRDVAAVLLPRRRSCSSVRERCWRRDHRRRCRLRCRLEIRVSGSVPSSHM